MTPEEKLETIARIRLSLAKREQPVQVLLVEDNENDAMLTKSSLESFGIRVTWAKGAKETEDHLIANDPFLIFLDLKMSAHDDGSLGLNILSYIKAYKPHIHIFILTGVFDHTSPYCMRALEKGADAIWSKPLTDEQIQLIFGAA